MGWDTSTRSSWDMGYSPRDLGVTYLQIKPTGIPIYMGDVVGPEKRHTNHGKKKKKLIFEWFTTGFITGS